MVINLCFGPLSQIVASKCRSLSTTPNLCLSFITIFIIFEIYVRLYLSTALHSASRRQNLYDSVINVTLADLFYSPTYIFQ